MQPAGCVLQRKRRFPVRLRAPVPAFCTRGSDVACARAIPRSQNHCSARHRAHSSTAKSVAPTVLVEPAIQKARATRTCIIGRVARVECTSVRTVAQMSTTGLSPWG